MKSTIKFLFVIFLSLTFSGCNNDRSQETTIEKTADAKISSRKMPSIEMRIDSKVTKDNSIVFNTREEAEHFVENIRNELALNNSFTFRCKPGIYTGTAWTTGFTSLNFEVSVGENGCIAGITGYISGITIPYSWSTGETSFGCTSGTACGTLNINIFYQNIGTIYSIHQCYNISLSC